ncbi:MAG: methylated-DNA--[protein]-cysteine S-methyltransferase [Candidatus Limnocylindrales bacterium]
MPDHAVYRTLHDPSGPFRIAATEHGIVAADWELDEAVFRARLERRLGAPVEPAAKVAADDPARRLLDAAWPTLEGLLHGTPTDVSAVPIDLRDRPAFDRRVLAAVHATGWGRTASYGAIARAVGAPRAARAVGGAVSRNPISMVIPCHRIIASDGTLGGYGGTGWVDRDRQLSRKEALLLREGVIVSRRSG